MTNDWRTPAGRRYTARLFSFMAIYVVVLLGVTYWFKHAPPAGALRYAAAVAPAVPLLGVIWAMAAYLIELPDEYQRLRLARSLLWGAGLTMAVCTVWGFLQNFTDVPAPPLYLVFVLYMALFGAVQCGSSLLERSR